MCIHRNARLMYGQESPVIMEEIGTAFAQPYELDAGRTMVVQPTRRNPCPRRFFWFLLV
jgi:hypothetical protein